MPYIFPGTAVYITWRQMYLYDLHGAQETTPEPHTQSVGHVANYARSQVHVLDHEQTYSPNIFYFASMRSDCSILCLHIFGQTRRICHYGARPVLNHCGSCNDFTITS